MEQLVHDGIGKCFKPFLPVRRDVLPAGESFLQLRPADFIEFAPQGNDSRGYFQRRKPFEELADLLADDIFSLFRFLATLLQVGGDYLLKIVDGVKVDVFDIIYRRVDISAIPCKGLRSVTAVL